MVAFLASIIGLVAMVAIAVAVARRRPLGTPLTWGEGFLAATYVFFALFLAYGVVPHQWLSWADNELKWRRDVFFFGENGITFFGRGRILFPKEVMRDIVASALYIVFLLGQIALWLWWQKREKGGRSGGRPQLVSAFGRPIVKKA